MRTYSELILLPTFEERIKYLQIGGTVGYQTFGSHRYLNQQLYKDSFWKEIRRKAILRDSDGKFVLDLAHQDYPFDGSVYVHHIEPITIEDILKRRSKVFDLENLICCRFKTHQTIHYSKEEIDNSAPVVRKPNDTCLWR